VIGSSIGYEGATTLNSTVNVAPPSAYTAGSLLLMAAIGGNATPSTVFPSTPSGWTAISTGGAKLGIFQRIATASEFTYTVPFSAPCAAAVLVVAYPPSTVVTSAAASVATSVITYTPTFPGGVTGTETVALFTANQVFGSGTLSGGESFNQPGAPWSVGVPPFGPGLQQSPVTAFAVNVGMTDVVGSTSSPTMTTPLDSTFYSMYVVLGAPTASVLTPPPHLGGPQFIAGSTPRGTLGLGDTFANLTNQITESFQFLTYKPVFRATQITTAQTLVAGVQGVNLNNVLEDPYGGWVNTAGTFWWLPPPILSGWFLCTGNVFTAAPAGTNSVTPYIGTNGNLGSFAGSQTSNPTVAHTNGRPVVAIIYAAGGQNWIQLQAQLAGANLNTSVTPGQNSHMEIVWVSS
jgi:hypothetical protein